jgi:predicted Mrr-cat superfamily restriction endonuclease
MNCWILKSKEDEHGKPLKPMWPHFKEEKVIAIGWDVPDNKWTTESEIASEIHRYDTGRGDDYIKSSANKVYKFLWKMEEGDNVVLCDGYKNTQERVYLYGFAEITSKPRYEANSDWWKIKRDVHLFLYERNVSRKELADILGKGQCIGTIFNLECEKYLKLRSHTFNP